MPTDVADIYISSNGDCWRLIHDGDTGRYVVRHEPNLSSGGKATESTIDEFLRGSGTSPQAEALRALLEREAAVEK
jgi:hypothetical protein